MYPWMIGSAMLRTGGEAWARQLRAMQVMQEAAWQQTRVFWGLAHPVPVAPVTLPAKTAAKKTRGRAAEPEMNDVPV